MFDELLSIYELTIHSDPRVQGIQFLTKACDMNNATACFYLSGLHISGVETKEAEVTATTKHTGKSSSPGHGTPPAVPAVAPAAAKDFIVEKDMVKAFGFAYKACELKNMYACANLSQMYARGEGTAKSDADAEKYRKMAVEMQDEVKNHHGQLTFQQGLSS